MKQILTQLFKNAMIAALGEAAADCSPMIQPAGRAEYGDYQANFALRLAKHLHLKPMDVAEKVIAHLDHKEIFSKIEPSGPGFINIFLADDFLAAHLQELIDDERLGVTHGKTQTIVVDYGGANVAKEMHVGHSRSAIIGDAIVRILSFLGNNVIRQNHLGDWGTQFGMLIEYLIETGAHSQSHSVSDLDTLYKKSKQRFDDDAEFADKARARVVALQAGDPQTVAIWQQLVTESRQYIATVYEKLQVLLTDADVRGESSYNKMLPEVVAELEKLGLAENSLGATVVFLEGFLDANDKPFPLIIRKKDAGFLYATADLAAVKHRIEQLAATRLIYVTDARQKQHFAMIFAVAHKAGWDKNNIKLEHVPFGAILGKDNKPFKTRSGESIKLIDVLNEAEKRAATLASEKNPQLSVEQLTNIGETIGIGALKYADLRTDKVRDYVFDWDKMLAFDGNTAPYLQNAYVRIRAIFRKGNIDSAAIKSAKIILTAPTEHQLAIKILEFPDIINSVAEDLSIHRLGDYLYDLAATFHKFYEHCPILTAESPEMRLSRLMLCELIARTLKLGLNLLGINVVEMM